MFRRDDQFSRFMVPSGENPAVRLKGRSWGALALVCGLLVIHQVLLLPALARLSDDAPVINIAGRQRMLSQKLAKTALAWQTASTVSDRRNRRSELEAIVNEWTRAHLGLQLADAALQLPRKNSAEVDAAFALLEPEYQPILDAARNLLAHGTVETAFTTAQIRDVDQILQHEDEYLAQMHALVGLFAKGARSHVWQLQVLGWAIAGTILFVLIAVQTFVVRPAVDIIGSRVATSEERYRRLVETMSEGLIVHDLNGRIRFANPRFCEWIGAIASELDGHVVSSWLIEADRDRYSSWCVQTGSSSETAEFAFRARDGRVVDTIASHRPLPNEQGDAQGYLLVVTDVTARKKAEQRSRELLDQLAHADRLKSMGQLAAGLAHEINQPLAAIVNYAEACLMNLTATSSSAETLQGPLQRILSAALRGGEIIRRSRQFAQRRPHDIRSEVLNDLVEEVEQLCRPEAKRRNVQIELDLDTGLPSIPVDGIQIQQVLTNLIQNALTALERAAVSPPYVKVTTARDSADFVSVSVSDNGPGFGLLDPQDLFQPFFTSHSEGLGLGLAISRNIVESHGGALSAKQNPGGGATFRMTLPIQAPATASARSHSYEEPVHV